MNILIEMRTPNCECVINIDPHQLSQVIRNLVSNALKFTNKPGLVKVTVDVVPRSMYVMSSKNAAKNNKVSVGIISPDMSRSSHFLRLTVTDFGAGISEQNQAKLFKGIIQFNPGKLQEGKGTGLGLYISKGIVDTHKGQIWVESKGEGQGTTFTMILPAESADAHMMLTSTAMNSSNISIVKSESNNRNRDSEVEIALSLQNSKMITIVSNADKDNFSPNHVYRIESDAEYANLVSVQGQSVKTSAPFISRHRLSAANILDLGEEKSG